MGPQRVGDPRPAYASAAPIVRLLRVAAQCLEVEHRDVATAGLEDPQRAQDLQGLADGLAGGAGPGGQLLLGERKRDLAVAPARAVAAVEAGRADYVSAVPVDRVPALDLRYGPHSAVARAGRQRYFSGTEPTLHFFALNASRPLFASTRMRQAVNAALDRRALARRVPFPPVPAGVPGRPTDQFTPPGLPGFHDAAIYPLGGPDLERARALAGSRKRRAVLYTCNLPPCLDLGRVARRNLAAIGLDVEVKSYSLNQMFVRMHQPEEPWDIGYFNFFADFPDASDFVATLFPPPGEGDPNVGHFDDEKIARGIVAARRLTGAARVGAFAQLDAGLARRGAGAPFATAVTTDFFSDRIGCQVHQPIYGISLAALCVRR